MTSLINPIDHHIKLRYAYFVQNAKVNYMPHQENGVIWCAQRETVKLENQSIHGGIIADEMGCGKTLMTIGLITCHFVPKTLIVVPQALIQQWYVAIFKATGHKPLLYYGHRIKSAVKHLSNAPIVITTYGVISHRNATTQSPMFSTTWDRVIYDEAHHMRNSNTNRFVAGHALRSNIKWLITGTPLQNEMKDLYNLSNIIGIHDKTTDLSDYMLRRTKESVGIYLPAIHHNIVKCEWSNHHESKLASILHPTTSNTTTKKKLKHLSSKADSKSDSDIHHYTVDTMCDDDLVKEEDINVTNPSDCCLVAEGKDSGDESPSSVATTHDTMSGYEIESEIDKKLGNFVLRILGYRVIVWIVRARQMCTCPKLLSVLRKNINKCDLHDITPLQVALTGMSKINQVVAKLESRQHNGNCKIVFCHFREEMDIIKHKLSLSGMKDVVIYDGRLTRKQRTRVIESKPSILILQTQMGCEGLNLQYANEVYMVGPVWNPATEDQAIARCYRLGQKKETHVFRFIMTSADGTLPSMDTYMNSVIDDKRMLQQEVGL